MKRNRKAAALIACSACIFASMVPLLLRDRKNDPFSATHFGLGVAAGIAVGIAIVLFLKRVVKKRRNLLIPKQHPHAQP